MEDNYQLVNKKNMFLNLLTYYTGFDHIDVENEGERSAHIINPVESIPYTYYVRIDFEK